MIKLVSIFFFVLHISVCFFLINGFSFYVVCGQAINNNFFPVIVLVEIFLIVNIIITIDYGAFLFSGDRKNKYKLVKLYNLSSIALYVSSVIVSGLLVSYISSIGLMATFGLVVSLNIPLVVSYAMECHNSNYLKSRCGILCRYFSSMRKITLLLIIFIIWNIALQVNI